MTPMEMSGVIISPVPKFASMALTSKLKQAKTTPKPPEQEDDDSDEDEFEHDTGSGDTSDDDYESDTVDQAVKKSAVISSHSR